MNVTTRQMIEKKIAKEFIQNAIAAGYSISVDVGYGDEITLKESIDCNKVLNEMFSVDEEHLYLYKDGKPQGWVYLVYGNDGWDVIADYTTNLEPLMESVQELADELCEQYY